MPWYWDSGPCPTLTAKNAKFVRIEITEQSLANWFPVSGSSQALPNLDWTTGAIEGRGFPWTVPELQKVSSAEPGVAGNASISIEAMNEFAGASGNDVSSGSLVIGNWYVNDGYDEVSHAGLPYADGEYFLATTGSYTTTGTGQVRRYMTVYDILTEYSGKDYAIWIRLSTKSTVGAAWRVQYVGVLDQSAIEKEVYDIRKPETWIVKVNADDPLQLLKRVTAAQWMSAGDGLTAPTAQYGGLLRADWDYTTANLFFTFVGSITWAGTTFPPGRYSGFAFKVPKPGQENSWWEFNVAPGASPGDQARFIKIVDILSQINEFLGFEAAINNGANWSDCHSWTYYYNQANSTGSGGEDLVGVGIDSLWVPSGFYVSPQYYEAYSFFDPYESGPHSWKRCADPLEVLDRICISHGLVYRTRVNNSGQRYLEIVEAGKYTTTKTIDDMNKVLRLIEKPNTFTCDGVEIVSTGSAIGSSSAASNVKRGSGGTSTLKYDTYFLSTNALRIGHDFRAKVISGATVSGARVFDLRPVDTEYFCGLFVLTGITSKAATNAYSVCVIQPKDNASGASAGYIGAPENGEFRTGGIAFPKVTTGDPNYSSFTEVPAMALSHYMWNLVDSATDPVGLARPHGSSIEIDVVGIDYDQTLYPPLKLETVINGVTREYVITEIVENLADDFRTYRGHTREI